MEKKFTPIPAILCTLLSGIALPIWLVFFVIAYFLGGSPGPDFERSVPNLYIGVIALGFLGAVLALATGVMGLSAKPARKYLPLCATLLGVMGSVPFFLMDLTAVGLFALPVGILPTVLYLIFPRKQSGEKE